MLSVCAAAAFAALCAAALRKYSAEVSALVLVAAAVMSALLALPYIESILSQIAAFSEAAAVSEKYMTALIKSVGICLLTQLTADICRENGAQSAASQAELCGKLAILLIACPLYADLLAAVSEFLM